VELKGGFGIMGLFKRFKKIEDYYLLFLIFLTSGCAIAWQLLLGNVASYLTGDVLLEFSITLATFMLAMALSSWLVKFFNDEQLKHVLNVSAAALVVLNSFAPLLLLPLKDDAIITRTLFGFSFTLGFFVGMQLPVLMRLYEKGRRLANVVSDSFMVDYVGAVVGAVLVIFLLPKLGYVKSFIFFSLALGLGVLFYDVSWFVAVAIVVSAFIWKVGDNTVEKMLESKYGKTVYLKRSRFQEIRYAQKGKGEVLYLDGNVQFTSFDAKIYHENLLLGAEFLKNYKNFVLKSKATRVAGLDALVIGGGDLFAASWLIAQGFAVTLCELDREVVEAAKNWEGLLYCDLDRVLKETKFFFQDAYKFVWKEKKKYDVIVVDLPDPHNYALAKLYSVEFYSRLYELMENEGVLMVQSSSPLKATKAFWCINKSLREAGFKVLPLRFWMPSLKVWGVNVAFKDLKLAESFGKIYREKIIFPKYEFELSKGVEASYMNYPEVIYYYLREGFRNGT